MSNKLTPTANDIEHVNCPVCEADNSVVWMEDGKQTRYVRCRTCRTVYASPRASKSVRYAWLDTTYGYGEKAFQNSRRRQPVLAQEAAILQNHITGGKLLDIGCDLGDLFNWFQSREWQRFGIELSPSAAAYANKTYDAQIFTGTVREATFPNAFFDLVTMLDMLYLVDDPRADLEEVKRIIKPGGLLAIEISGQRYQLMRSRGFFCWLLDHHWTRLSTDSSYLYWFSPNGLEKLLGNCGFRVNSTYIVGSPTSSSFFRNNLAGVYRTFINTMFRVSRQWLTLAPKYLLIAQCIK
jgi:2-polyprenyl-3-methyl-5-hydroxy-6-metoxy-1,4-benzoquinol methylase